MAGVLMRAKLQWLRNSFTGTRKALMISGLVAGVAAVAATYWLVAGTGDAAGDVLALAMASWVIGWVLGPMMGGDPGIRREHLAHVPLPPRRKAVALFAASLVGIGPLVMLAAAASLIWYAARLSGPAVVVAVMAVALLVPAVVAVSNVAVAAIGAAIDSRAAAVLTAVPWAVLICLTAQGWAVIAAFGGQAGAVPPGFHKVLRAMPSGWPVAAVEAAGRGDWAVVAAALAGLGAILAGALLVWGRLLRRPPVTPVIRPAGTRRWRPGGPITAVVGKELRGWSRDLIRLHFMTFSLVYAITFTVLPILVGATGFLPLTGIVAVAMAAGCNAHLYSSDGTALWQTLMRPGAERADVRGRQLAWLLVVTPPAVLLTVAGAWAHGDAGMLIWAAALLPVTLGGGAGALMLVSVFMPVRMADAHRRGGNPGQDGGSLAGLVWLVLPILALAAAPVIAVVLTTGGAMRWTAVPLGCAIGALCAWGLGRLAHRRVTSHGPELLAKVGAA